MTEVPPKNPPEKPGDARQSVTRPIAEMGLDGEIAIVQDGRRVWTLPQQTEERRSLTLDEYQDGAASTAIYPRVFTEDQVMKMVTNLCDDIHHGLLSGTSYVSMKRHAQQHLNTLESPWNRLVYPILGLVGEAGEIANKAKKIARDKGGNMDTVAQDDAHAELGDVLWYVSAMATELDTELSDVGSSNLDKLSSRKERGVLGGSGDNR